MVDGRSGDTFSTFDEGVVDGDGSAETGALGPTNVNWC